MVKTAGIFSIIGGIFGIVSGASVAAIGALAGLAGMGMFSVIGAPLIGIGIVALIGGIFTLKRRTWGFALTGAICALFPIVPLGIMAIIFLAVRKNEFD